MAVFYNSDDNAYALVSYKSLYSRFTAADTWQELAVDATPRTLARAVLRGALRRTWLLTRSPYDRTVSAFMDKFRKQPKRIDQPDFEWQHCHRIFWPLLGLSGQNTDCEIAERFLHFTFDEFINALPDIYTRDGHFRPQYLSGRLLAGQTQWLPWPACRVIRIEDESALATVPGIDFSVRTNTTGHLSKDFTLNDHHRSVIQKLYRPDFKLGGYSF